MDKDVEVSRDQNTVIVDCVRYIAQSTSPAGNPVTGCYGCDIGGPERNRAYCSLIPCSRVDRSDKVEHIFIKVN